MRGGLKPWTWADGTDQTVKYVNLRPSDLISTQITRKLNTGNYVVSNGWPVKELLLYLRLIFSYNHNKYQWCDIENVWMMQFPEC